MTDITKTNLYGVAIGSQSTDPFVIHFDTRDPTSYDVNYPVQKRWFNTALETYWILVGFSTIGGTLQAVWDQIGFGPSTMLTLTGNSGGPVSPDVTHTINVVGDAIGITIAGVPGTHTLTASLVGGGVATQNFNVDAHTAPGTDPVVPNSSGQVAITGAQVAAGTTTNVIRTDSLAANTFTIEVQRSQAVASTTIGDNGVCHFNSSQFSVDANGFVTLSGGGEAIDSIAVQTGTSPIVPTVAGLVTINGATVAAGTNPVRTDGTGANTMAIEVQISQAIAATDATKIGLAAFNSADFTVDANGFVSITNFSPFSYVQINHASSPYTVTATDEFISCDASAGVISIRLPNAPTTYRQFVIKDRTGSASTNHISVTTVGGVVTIDGATTYTLAGNYGSIQLLFNGTSYEVF